jgi:predicted DNA-binding transcriptional regulator AlpA
MTLLTVDEISQMVKLSRNYTRDKLVKRGDFPRPSLSLSQKTRRWDASAVVSWLEKNQGNLSR